MRDCDLTIGLGGYAEVWSGCYNSRVDMHPAAPVSQNCGYCTISEK